MTRCSSPRPEITGLPIGDVVDTGGLATTRRADMFIDLDDDPRHPILQLGYNTLTHLKERTPSASGAEEAKWNYAFWLQNELTFIG